MHIVCFMCIQILTMQITVATFKSFSSSLTKSIPFTVQKQKLLCIQISKQ